MYSNYISNKIMSFSKFVDLVMAPTRCNKMDDIFGLMSMKYFPTQKYHSKKLFLWFWPASMMYVFNIRLIKKLYGQSQIQDFPKEAAPFV